MKFKLFDLMRQKSNGKESRYCKYVCDSLIFDCKNNVRYCPFSDTSLVHTDFNGIWLDIERLKKLKSDSIDIINSENSFEVCNSCDYLSLEKYSKSQPLKYLYLSNWKNCYLNCLYCEYPKEEDLIKAGHYDVFNSIVQLIDNRVIDVNTKIIFDCGDATIHPEFDKILYYFINYEMKHIVIHTPALRYCESVSTAIAKNIAEVVISFDSGCPYIYQKIKGYNKFDIAVANIKKYLSFQEPSEKRVVLKYTLLEGINDNQKELLDWFMFARDIGIKKLAIDIDEKWYNQIRNSIPQYLKEIIIFVKNISSYNNIEIEFYDKINFIFQSIDKKEKV